MLRPALPDLTPNATKPLEHSAETNAADVHAREPRQIIDALEPTRFEIGGPTAAEALSGGGYSLNAARPFLKILWQGRA